MDDFYNVVENGGNAVNAWTDQNILDPVYDWGTGVNNWMDERSTGEKIATSLAPATAPLLFTEAEQKGPEGSARAEGSAREL